MAVIGLLIWPIRGNHQNSVPAVRFRRAWQTTRIRLNLTRAYQDVTGRPADNPRARLLSGTFFFLFILFHPQQSCFVPTKQPLLGPSFRSTGGLGLVSSFLLCPSLKQSSFELDKSLHLVFRLIGLCHRDAERLVPRDNGWRDEEA